MLQLQTWIQYVQCYVVLLNITRLVTYAGIEIFSVCFFSLIFSINLLCLINGKLFRKILCFVINVYLKVPNIKINIVNHLYTINGKMALKRFIEPFNRILNKAYYRVINSSINWFNKTFCEINAIMLMQKVIATVEILTN